MWQKSNNKCLHIHFQEMCGYEYTNKLQRMFQDMNVSKDLNDKFKKHLSVTESLDSKGYVMCIFCLCY